MAFSASIKSAQQKPNKFDLSGTTITTCDFFCCKPVFCAELVPGQSVNIDCRAFARCEPIQKPLYGSAKLYHRFFFVPNRTVMTAWDDFITQKSTFYSGASIMSQVPYIKNDVLVDMFVNALSFQSTSLVNVVDSEVSQGGAYDFYLQSNPPHYYRFTSVGKRLYDILVSLGFSINFSSYDETPLSALPLLSFCRIFFDFYRNSAFSDAGQYASLEKWFSRVAAVGVTSPYISLTRDQVGSLLMSVYRVFYEQDYFTLNQKNAVGGNDVSFSSNDLVSDPGGNVIGVGSNAKPFLETGISPQSTSREAIYQYGLDTLKAFTDYVKRQALAGWKAADRYLARFGITLSDSKLNQSIYLGRQVLDLQISDVMSNADTTGASLGDYSGKGVFVGDSGKISYSASEYGFLICVQSCVPMTGYVQGRPRYMQHLKRFDFYSPEFDRAGMQATRFDELFADFKTKEQVEIFNDVYDAEFAPNGVFGYLPRYAEYKVGRDILSGDFICNSRNAQLDGYHFFRLFDFTDITDPRRVISASFCRGDQEQFDRIFTETSGFNDGITCVIRFIDNSYSPMSQLFENYDFDGFKQVQLDLQGRHVQ